MLNSYSIMLRDVSTILLRIGWGIGGMVRLMLMGLLLIVNTFLYYAFEFESAYGYLAVVVLLCMPFVVPTMSRCQAEVTAEEQLQPTNETNDEEANGSHRQLQRQVLYRPMPAQPPEGS